MDYSGDGALHLLRPGFLLRPLGDDLVEVGLQVPALRDVVLPLHPLLLGQDLLHDAQLHRAHEAVVALVLKK